MPDLPGHQLQRLPRGYRCAGECYRLLPAPGNADGGATFIICSVKGEIVTGVTGYGHSYSYM